MRLPHALPLAAAAAVLLTSCQSTCSECATRETGEALAVVPSDDALRAPLLDAVRSLEGRWISETPYGEGEHVFVVTSGGSVVRELMAPGEPHEMTNMYHLDGNTLVMTHYCGAGNQPRMRAAALVDGRLEFASDSVSDLKDPGELYMGAMTLVFVDEDHVEQHWTAIEGGANSEMGVFKLTRAR